VPAKETFHAELATSFVALADRAAGGTNTLPPLKPARASSLTGVWEPAPQALWYFDSNGGCGLEPHTLRRDLFFLDKRLKNGKTTSNPLL
jgi:hypothetical protein